MMYMLFCITWFAIGIFTLFVGLTVSLLWADCSFKRIVGKGLFEMFKGIFSVICKKENQ